MNAQRISQTLPDRIVLRKDENGWICAYDLFKKVIIRRSRFGRERVVNDTGRDKAQERDAEGFIRFRMKREYDTIHIS